MSVDAARPVRQRPRRLVVVVAAGIVIPVAAAYLVARQRPVVHQPLPPPGLTGIADA